MAIQTQSFTTIVSNAVTAIQGRTTLLIDMTVGSVLRAFVEAIALVTLWLQGVALQIAAQTRFATSNGTDADTWAADFGFARLPSQVATGQVTFARFTATAQATVPVGTIVQTADGSQKYRVVADLVQPAYNAALGVYVLGAGVSSITATVNSLVAAAAGNVNAGYINTLGGALAGVDTVTNALNFANGSDPETDAAFRLRFVSYIASLSKGTKTAIGNAILSLQLGVNYTLTENFTYAGAATLGYFYVVVDDGTGSPSAGFISTVYNAIDAVRAEGSTFSVFAPVLVTANVSMTITTSAGYSHSAIVALVLAAVQGYINGLSIGATLPYTKLATLAYGASAAVTNVTGITINGGTADVSATPRQIIKAGTITVI